MKNLFLTVGLIGCILATLLVIGALLLLFTGL